MLSESNSTAIMESGMFIMYVKKGVVVDADTQCLVINKHTNERYNDRSDTVGAWCKFVNDWRNL